MTSAFKLAVFFELLGGIAGWIWIIAGVGVIVAVIGAIFFGFSWWNVLYLGAAAAIGKWILRRSLENAENINAVEFLKSKGLSHQDARRVIQIAYSNYGLEGVRKIYTLSDEQIALM